jgi:hypothetical protein
MWPDDIPTPVDAAMNTIPLTPDAYKPTYTVLGGGRGSACTEGFPVSVLLLNRGPRLFRAAMIQDLVKVGFDSIVSVEGASDSPELEGIAARFPQVRFICMQEEANPGVRINIGMRESCAPYVLVLWNDMRLATSALSSRFFDKVTELDAACLVPTLGDAAGSIVPSIGNPAQSGAAFRIVPLQPRKDGEKSLYPFDACGIYSRERFTLLGGYDWTIGNPYWQKIDFGMRAWLWGETIQYAQALRLNYDGASPVEDTTPDADYGRFWLKNLAPVYHGDHAAIPGSRFFKYLIRSRKGPKTALDEFKAARVWVGASSFRFKQDAARMADLWDPLS